MIYFYRCFARLVRAGLRASQVLLPSKLRRWVELRDNAIQLSGSGPVDVWVHAASGEIEYAKPWLAALARREQRVLLTYSSPSAERMLRSLPEGVTTWPLPWDTPGDVAAFLKAWQPRSLWIARTDLWPEVLYQCGQSAIPVYLFAATLSAHSSRTRGVGRLIFRWLARQLREIFCVAEADRLEFLRLDAGLPVRAIGDPRYDQVFHRLAQRRSLPESLWPAAVVAGSTWPEDEAWLLDAWQVLHHESAAPLWLVPHEPSPEHLSELEQEIARRGLRSARWREVANPAGKRPDIVIVDELGWLAELYPLAPCAFVGGSVRRKVHSVMEALASGARVLTGPCMQNNREAVEFAQKTLQDGTHLVQVCSTSNQLAAALRQTLQCQTGRTEIVGFVREKTGATDKLLEFIR